MSRQYFQDTLIDPNITSETGVTSTSETQLWNVPRFTPIPANDPRVGKIYRVTAGGTLTANTTTGTITMTPRIGTTVAGGTTLGAGPAKIVGTTFTTQSWFLEFVVVFRSIGNPGANSGVIGHGSFQCTNTAASNQDASFCLGGTLATCDVSIAQGISIGVALSSGTMTTNFVYIQSLN